MLLDTDEGKAAATDLDLLAQVAKHKTTFFRSGWASYDTAKPGSLRLRVFPLADFHFVGRLAQCTTSGIRHPPRGSSRTSEKQNRFNQEMESALAKSGR